MQNTRVYQNQDLAENKIISLDEDATHYVKNVLRLKPENTLSLVNGDGQEYLSTILQINKKSIDVKVNKKSSVPRESNLQINLVQGVSKTDKMDFALQKGTELGISKIIPLISTNCSVKQSKTFLDKKREHWKNVVISACMQSGRNVIPEICPIVQFEEFLLTHQNEQSVILDPNASASFKAINPSKKINVLIGPEGGFTEEEIKTAKSHGVHPISLGPRILRTETAAVSAITALQLLFGDLG